MSIAVLAKWMTEQQLKGPSMKDAPVFYKNLEEEMDKRRVDHGFQFLSTQSGGRDFSSNDTLSFTSSGVLRKAFLEELEKHPDFALGSTGSRILDGNNSYIETVEKEIAEFHGAESALLVGSGFEANTSIFAAIPRLGDAIIYDELVHASMTNGIQQGIASCKLPFKHNDVNAFKEVLTKVKETQPQIANGKRTVLVALESVYSMDGDASPVQEFINIANELLPTGNTAFVYDEAHSTGSVGPRGAGMAVHLGLQKEIAIRVHTYGKAMGSHGAAIVAKKSVKDMLLNFAKGVVFATAPSFPMIASIRASYTLLRGGAAEERQAKVTHNVRSFISKMKSNPVWEKANQAGILSIPVGEGIENKTFVSHVVPIWTRSNYNKFLVFHLYLAKYRAWPIGFPTVPKGTERIRLAFHADNTEREIDGLASSVCEWAQEMLFLESNGPTGQRLPKAARRLYTYSSRRGNKDSVPSVETGVPISTQPAAIAPAAAIAA